MKIRRNQPCPCGSGKKYKVCCLPLDRKRGMAGSRASAAPTRVIARGVERWEADYVPLGIVVEDDPGTKTAARMIVADGAPIETEMLSNPPFEVPAAAADLAAAVLGLVEQLGSPPRTLVVRQQAIVEPLAELLAPVKIAVEHEERPPAFEAVEGGLLEHFYDDPRQLPTPAQSWAGWQQPEPWIRSCFAAAAAFFQAAPWRVLRDQDVLEIETQSGRPWSASVVGHGESVFGVSLARSSRPFVQMVLAQGASFDPYTEIRDELYTILFYEAHELPRPMRKEILRHGWTVAAPDAYPNLLSFRTLAGGISQADAADLLMILELIPRYLAARATPEAPFHDAETGATVRQESMTVIKPTRLAPITLELGFVQGPGAEPAAGIAFLERSSEEIEAAAEPERKVINRFRAALTASGLADKTVSKHAQAVEILFDFLIDFAAVPYRALHEIDLRTFLYDWYPRKAGVSDTTARALLGALKHFFTFLSEQEGLHCPWAKPLLGNRETFLERWNTCPQGFFWDESVIRWRTDLHPEHDAYVFLPDEGLGERDGWGATMGMVEAELHCELQRRWLVWRDELIADGTDRSDTLWDRLLDRQRAWERAPHSRFNDKTPEAVVLAERLKRERRKSAAESDPLEGE